MDNSDFSQLNIEISASDATEEEIDRMTRQLLVELRDTDIESAALVRGGDAPAGTKAGDFATIGSIVVSALPAVLPGVVALVQAWAARGQGRTVKFKGKVGREVIEFEGSPEELQKLLSLLETKQPAEETQLTAKKEKFKPTTREDSEDLEEARPRKKTSKSPKIFISYRRADSTDIAGRIYDRLTAHFGKPAIFKDVDSIPPGIDFKEHLEKAVGRCKVFLVVIGDKWLEPTALTRKSRLHDPSDFVRIEIEAALSRDILIIPLLIRGTSMPMADKLPPSLRKLVYRNAIPVRSDPDFHRDMDRLIEAISNFC